MSERCSIPGCDNDARKRGMCGMHYLRWWKHGDALFVPFRSYRATVAQRLLIGAVRTTTGCLVFRGSIKTRCYGLMQINNRVVQTHRVSYEHHVSRIPAGLFVLHKCDNPGCIEPSHLFLGTQKDNMQDMIRKGRKTRLYAKLSHSKAAEIRSSSEPARALAKRYGVSVRSISSVRRGVTWPLS